MEILGRDVLVLCTDISFMHQREGADGQYRLLEIDPDNNKIFSRLKYAETEVYVSGYIADAGRVLYSKHELAEFVSDIKIGPEIFKDGFESGDLGARSDSVP